MPGADPCPDKKVLNQFLLGDLPEPVIAAVQQHLAGCGPCVQTLENMPASDTLLDALRRARTPAGAEDSAVERLVDKLQATATPASAADTSPHYPVAPGSVEPGWLGPYRLLKLLGVGGMGMVYEAEDTQLRRRVALKVMKPESAANADHRERFLREARAAAALQHDHVVNVHHVGEDGGVPFLVMQLLEGESLEERLRREAAKESPATFALAEALRIGRETAEGLAAAHGLGLTHRDVKPANIFLARGAGPGGKQDEPAAAPRVKLLDFGLALRADDESRLTRPGMVVGTPDFMSPEQAVGEDVDHRCDLFSLGVVLYRLSTGQLPFRGANVLAVLHALGVEHPRAPRECNPAVPRSLSDLVMRLLAKAPKDRPQTAAEVVGALAAIEEETRTQADKETTAAGPAPPCPLVGEAMPRARQKGGPAWSPRRPALVLSAVGLLGAAALLIRTFPERPDPSRGAGARPGPVQILRLDVRHFAREGDKYENPRGPLGRKSFGTRLNDSVTVEAGLSAPAYCYLIAYRPDGTEEVCFPEDEDAPPPATDGPKYPSVAADVRYGLTEGTGLMAFALAVSREPLPAYAAWRRQRDASPWRKAEAPPDVVWRLDGAGARAATPDDPDDVRGKGRKAKELAPLVELLSWLRQEQRFETVSVVAFPVLPRK